MHLQFAHQAGLPFSRENKVIKAIETVYNGYRFRSRLEARWAVFFDTLGIEYQYEPEGFDLGNGIWYLPDFWLPDFELWVEIKGTEPSHDEQSKAALLAQQGGKTVLILWCDVGKRPENHTMRFWNDSNGVFHSHSNGYIMALLMEGYKGYSKMIADNGIMRGTEQTVDLIHCLWKRAHTAARQARFGKGAR